MGTFTISQMADLSSGQLVALPTPVVLPFRGTFRMPFAVDRHGKAMKSDRKSATFYLADDLRTLLPSSRRSGQCAFRLFDWK
jgi:hypothetical protein